MGASHALTSRPPSLLRAALRSPAFWLFLLTAAVFSVFADIDLLLAARYYVPQRGFTINEYAGIRVLHEVWGDIPQYTALALALYVGAGAVWKRLGQRGRQRAAVFLLLALLLGPSLGVNALKETWGRARPKDLVEFGGSARFTPALVPSSACDHNCAFTSGHAAFGFWFMTPAFFVRRRRWLWLAAGIALGLAMGWVRMAQGGHFLSDVLFSGWIVYGVGLALSAGLSRWWRMPPPWDGHAAAQPLKKLRKARN
jgi:lipid A 4'-phosphatase